jgi:hypothetical protein
MTDAEVLAKAEHICCELTALIERLRAKAGEEPSASQEDSPPRDLMRPGDAVHKFGIPRSTLHRLCREHPLGSPGGFASFDPHKKRYAVSRSGLAALLRRLGRSGT